MARVIEAKKDYVSAVGRRKTSSARVRIFSGQGEIKINDKPMQTVFPCFEWQEQILAPLKILGQEGKFSISVKVNGGGFRSQAIAIQYGIARALVKYDESWRKTLKTKGYLTRDARIKERKKPGLKKARRAPQWSKR